MDLTKLSPKETHTFNVLLPDGTRSDIKIEIYSSDSRHYKTCAHKIRNLNMGKKNTSESIEQDTLQLICDSVKSWENLTENSVDVVCSTDNVKRVFTKFPWMAEQTDKEQNKKSNFLTIAQ